jgi:hypothetical protein
MTTLSRLTEDFVRIFGEIKSQFPNGFDGQLFRAKLTSQRFEALVQRFDSTVYAISHSEKSVTKKHFKQVHHEFPRAWAEYKKAWSSIPAEYIGHRIGDIDFDFDALLDGQDGASGKESQEPDWEDWDFDPDRQDAACLIDAMIAYVSDHAENGGPIFQQMAEAFGWFEARGLDLHAFLRRWNKVPITSVPKHVSDQHPIKGTEGLYWLLDQALQAYWFQADAAAIALFRALTEEVIERHYLGQGHSIREAERRFPHLKKHNLEAKIRVANEVLHEARLNVAPLQKKWGDAENFVREWALAIKFLIESAPVKRAR